jgi:hypothetical protein
MPTDLDQEKRTALLDRISALLAKTRANGCTEAEALAAAELAEKLMAKYGLSLGELESISSPADAWDVVGPPIGDRRCHEVVNVADAIAQYTDMRNWGQRYGVIHMQKDRFRMHGHHGVIGVFFGLAADVQVAIHLTDTLQYHDGSRS